MSHITTFEFVVDSLDELELSAADCDCELIRGKEKYKWFGTWVGDSPLPEEVKQEDLGKCDHVIRVKNAGSQTYEIGVKQREDGKYNLLYDFWSGGYGLENAVGKFGSKLELAYSVRHAEAHWKSQGYRTNVVKNPQTGNPQLQDFK